MAQGNDSVAQGNGLLNLMNILKAVMLPPFELRRSACPQEGVIPLYIYVPCGQRRETAAHQEGKTL
ncbi:MAG: hypothetical protein LBT48_01350 [Prevotellaceae bacterium]|jgi:hypothetical protein|nr:hypothetical protein [Prevotellaceae bacterium]